ncbi:MAG: DUF4172 domain-containing protein [Prevotellaceae bacterium]|jgi:Fic family protein|nr:DUF4172 domain-containing protein [Prevotellaceae bacterium]
MYFVYKHKNCPVFIWDNEILLNPLADVRYRQGRIFGRIESLALDQRKESVLETLTLDITKCAEMENISFNEEKVRISVARKLGLTRTKTTETVSEIDNMAEIMIDAIQNYSTPLTEERLILWHSTLFANEQTDKNEKDDKWLSKLTKIKQVVSKAIGKDKSYFRDSAAKEISHFTDWFNEENKLDAVVKAAIAYLWFITIRPFEAGNMLIAGALTNMLFARADNNPQRFYSMLAQMQTERKQYYEVLEKTQNENFDITNWMLWFFNCMKKALKTTDTTLLNVLRKAEFWKIHDKIELNKRQRLALNKLLGGADGKLQSSKWAQIAKCSSDTALRDMKDLIAKGILRQKTQGGRSTNYEIIGF